MTSLSLRIVALGAALVLIVSSCGGSTEGAADDHPTSTSRAVDTDGSSTPTSASVTGGSLAEVAEPITPDETIAMAVDALVRSGTYSFSAIVTLTVQDTEVETELDGWVDGSDRQITLRAGDAEVTTNVNDGIATVERDGEAIEVPLAEASVAPSLEILKAIRNPAFVDGGVEGKLTGNDLTELGYEINGAAVATVMIDADGALTGYMIQASNESWRILVSFTDV